MEQIFREKLPSVARMITLANSGLWINIAKSVTREADRSVTVTISGNNIEFRFNINTLFNYPDPFRIDR